MKMAALESSLRVLAGGVHPSWCTNNRKAPQTISIRLLRTRVCTSVASSTPTSTATTPTPLHFQHELLQHTTNLKKLYASNLPWSLSPADVKALFSQCGTVTDVEMIKNKDGGLTGFAFITMSSAQEAQAAIHKFHSLQISGRTIKVELAKRFKKPRPPGPPAGETRHKIYASNLAWKVRSGHLREFVTENFREPVSARVVFDSSSGRCAGYGFVSFVTKEEAEDAISSLDGKELMGRAVRLKFSRKTIEEADTDSGKEEQGYHDQLEAP
ncbi:31 kDa ribonucleoprotein, chloroplastic [Arachis ipaensis]|uniref:31 kDa ribonucleoprotein, chloroplastic n=1 Tax=Arachis ipaensis TaxID=130454 RepID=UPI000A2AFC66|nr:31 kDa ribonucleoprotein, chloroplastic [Arachis ipaensis]